MSHWLSGKVNVTHWTYIYILIQYVIIITPMYFIIFLMAAVAESHCPTAVSLWPHLVSSIGCVDLLGCHWTIAVSPGSVETGKKVHVIPGGRKGTEGKHVGHTAHVLCLAVASDGKFLVRQTCCGGSINTRVILYIYIYIYITVLL